MNILETLLSHSIPIVDVIHDLANEMNCSVSKNCSEYTLHLPASRGKGIIRGIDFRQGMGIISYDCQFNEDTEIRFIINERHPLKFIFCRQGHLDHKFENEAANHRIDQLENIIVASAFGNGHIIHFEAGIPTKINSLEIRRNEFVPNLDCELKELEEPLYSLFTDQNAKHSFYYHGKYSVRMADLFEKLEYEPGNSFLRRLFLEESGYRILNLQILEYIDDTAREGNASLLRKYEMDQIREAASIIDTEILDFVSVPELAHQMGLSATKLQAGFRELYGSTVNDYVHQRRLDLANSLLRKSDYTISEIVFLVGLSSKSYFSKIYKEKYGVSPSTVRGKYRSGNSKSNGNNRN